jgi:hypothetical protein
MKKTIKLLGILGVIAITAVTGFGFTACDDDGDDEDPLYTRWISNETAEVWANEERRVAFRFYLFDSKYTCVQSYEEMIPGNWITDYPYYYVKTGNQLTVYEWYPWNYRDDPYNPPYEVAGAYYYSISGGVLTLSVEGRPLVHGEYIFDGGLKLTKKVINVFERVPNGRLIFPTSGVTTLTDGVWKDDEISDSSGNRGRWYKIDLTGTDTYYLWLNDLLVNESGDKTAETTVLVAYHDSNDNPRCYYANSSSYGWDSPMWSGSADHNSSTVYIYVRKQDDEEQYNTTTIIREYAYGTFAIAYNKGELGSTPVRPTTP